MGFADKLAAAERPPQRSGQGEHHYQQQASGLNPTGFSGDSYQQYSYGYPDQSQAQANPHHDQNASLYGAAPRPQYPQGQYGSQPQGQAYGQTTAGAPSYQNQYSQQYQQPYSPPQGQTQDQGAYQAGGYAPYDPGQPQNGGFYGNPPQAYGPGTQQASAQSGYGLPPPPPSQQHHSAYSNQPGYDAAYQRTQGTMTPMAGGWSAGLSSDHWSKKYNIPGGDP